MSNQDMQIRPKDLLEGSLGDEIICVLRGRRKIRGKLSSFDQHLNLSLSHAVSLGEDNNPENQIGKIIVRGDTLVFVIFPQSGSE